MNDSGPTWFKNAVIYQLDVAYFRDSNGDGWGDLAGVIERLNHVKRLGASCIWLAPFHPSPWRDGGYDITDHRAVHPRLGTLDDFTALMAEADRLGLRVIVDLVVQHTASEHPWFQDARDVGSVHHDHYVWATQPEPSAIEPMFPTVDPTVWAWDERAELYYRHAFYDHEPDLDLSQEPVRQAVFELMDFWLDLGVSGFRVDAAPLLVERARAADPRDGGLWLLEQMADRVRQHRDDAVLIGEVDVPTKEYDVYFDEGRRLTMLLNFTMAAVTFLALARAEAKPLADALQEQPTSSANSGYANFLRNHDELDLERLDQDERAEVYSAFAPEPRMQVYDRGVRRRLAPMLGGDPDRIAMAHALLASLPGTPVIRYGDEIGMGDDLERPERDPVRTPMQWSAAPNGGFSSAGPADLLAPLVSDAFGPDHVNVAAQSTDPDSVLCAVQAINKARLGASVIGHDRAGVIDAGHPAVLCLRHGSDAELVVTVVNLGPDDVECRLPDLARPDVVERLSRGARLRADGVLALRGHGYGWFSPTPSGEVP